MANFYSEFWRDILEGRAYLPVYAAFYQQNGDFAPIPPYIFFKYLNNQD